MKRKKGIYDYLKIGERIKEMRLLNGISQRDFAKSLEIPVSTYSNYENGNRTPDLETIKRIAEALHIHFESLLLSSSVTSIQEDDTLDIVEKAVLSADAIEFEKAKIRTIATIGTEKMWKTLDNDVDIPLFHLIYDSKYIIKYNHKTHELFLKILDHHALSEKNIQILPETLATIIKSTRAVTTGLINDLLTEDTNEDN